MNSAVRLGLLLSLFLMILPFKTGAAPLGRAECQSAPSKILGRAVPYCVLLPPSYDASKSKYPILYFLHGLGDNEQMFIRSGGWNLIDDQREKNEIGEFLIVTPAAGASFYINSFDGRTKYSDFFLKEFIPFIERKYRVEANRSHRGIAGISMGGYGALRFAFLHPELFVSVSAHSAALIEKLPAVQTHTAMGNARLDMLGRIFGVPPDKELWDRNNPLNLARQLNRATAPKIYFDCGSEDGYGFYAGAQALDKILTAGKIPHEFHLYPGGHDWSYFAEHIGASLQFHSEAFSAAKSATK
jgi:S-formylglutathione hydrolase FrmB